MIRRILTLTLVACFALPAMAFAQEEEAAADDDGNGDGVFVVSSFKCDFTKIGDINDSWEAEGLPISQELVDEGMIGAAGVFYHLWGDDWNVHFWTVADDVSTFMAAFAEANARGAERYPEGLNIFDVCTEHKDNIYQLGESTEHGEDDD
jgi:hypothetical protein